MAMGKDRATPPQDRGKVLQQSVDLLLQKDELKKAPAGSKEKPGASGKEKKGKGDG
jgi:hypothetical protein